MSEGAVHIRSIRRLAVLRTEHVGDMLLTIPILRAIRAANPAVEVVLVTHATGEQLLRTHPLVHACVAVDRGAQHRSAREDREAAMAAKLRRHACDAALVLDLEPERNVALARAAGIAHIVAPTGPFDDHASVRTGEHRTHYDFRAAAPLGIEPGDPAMGDYLTGADREWALDFLAERGVDEGTPLLGMHVGCGKLQFRKRGPSLGRRLRGGVLHSRRLWPAASFVAVGRAFADRHDGRVLLTGVAQERGLAEPVLRQLGDLAIDAVGSTDVRRASALVDRCDAFLSTDTGPMHMAAALGTPLVAIFGPSARQAHEPIAPAVPTEVIQHPFPCAPCRGWVRRSCIDNRCMKAITPEEVLAALERVFHAARA